VAQEAEFGGTNPIKSGQEGIGFLVNQTARAFGQHITQEIRQFNLQLPGYVLLRHLLREINVASEGVTVLKLSTKVLLDPHDVAETAERLERDGWIKQEGYGEEARLKPTAKAFRVEPVLSASSHWMLEEALNGFSREEIGQLSSLLQRILHNLDAPVGTDEGPLGL
jgi:DNA-binding MarR family transcriptional regulator